MILHKFLSVLVALVLLLALSAGASQAQSEQLVGVGVSPPRVEVDLDSRSFEIPLRLQNHEETPREIVVSVTGLGHTLDGLPLYLEPALATEQIELSETEFTLAGGQSRDVVASGSIPEDEQSLYAAVVALFSEPGLEEGGQITARSRVASLLLLRAPRPWVETVKVVDVSILPPADKDSPLSVFAAAENTGSVHVKPTGRVRIVKDGKTLDLVDLPAQNIIPEYARRLLGEWEPPRKLTGRVKLVATTQNPAARGIGYVDFTPQGELAVPGMKIANLVARDDRGPLVEFVLTNSGTIPFSPTLSFDVSRDKQSVQDHVIEQSRMEPGDSEVIQWRPDALEDGVYLITVDAHFREQLLDQAATGLKLEDKGIPLWILMIGGGVLLLVLIALFLFFKKRKKKEKKEEDPEESDSEEAA